MNGINFELNNSTEYVYVRIPKKKAFSMANPRDSFINISKRIIEKFIWNNNEIKIHGEPIDVDIVLKEIDELRRNVYLNLQDKYIGKRVIMDGMTGGKINGHITDISLEEGMVELGRGNIQINSDHGLAILDLPTEESNRNVLESEIELERQKWSEENYKEMYEAAYEKLNESIKMEVDMIKSEADLEKYLKTRLYLIEEGMSLITTQFEVKGGIIDILARDKHNNLCIIELKTNRKPKDIIWQCMYYPLQFKEEIGLRMITVAPDYDDSIKVILNKIPYVEMRTYELNDRLIIK